MTFADSIEPPRTEYFLRGTAQRTIGTVPATARRARIANPLSGTVYALDPDIPMKQQKIRLTTVGAVSGERLRLDKRDLGPADPAPMVLPGPGRHRLELIDAGGKLLDRSIFTVR